MIENKYNPYESTIFSNNLTDEEIAQIIVTDTKYSPKIGEMQVADLYYDCNNIEIKNKKAVYYDSDGNAIDNPNANNARMASSFLRMLVQQKQDYALAKTFTLKITKDDVDSETDSEITESTDDDEYLAKWNKFLSKVLYKLAYKLCGDSVNHGIAWCYVYIDDMGELQLTDVPSDKVYPVWLDRNHTKLDRVVYNFTTKTYDSLNGIDTEYAEYWTNNKHILFNVSDGYKEVPLGIDAEGNPIHAQMTDEEGNEVSWDRVPFIAFKATDDEKTLLSFIKEYIDSYDKLNSRSVDSLIDELDPLLVFKGISPSISDLLEARSIAKMTKTISVDTDGDVNYIQANTPITSHLDKMENLRRDIIKFGYGVDYENARFGGNPNRLIIKSLYQNLDTYIDGLERHFQDFIENLKYFFDAWLIMRGEASAEELDKYNIIAKFDRSMMLNESTLIDDTLKLASTGVSKRTVLEFNPVVDNVELELERIKKEQEEERREQELYDFSNNGTDTEDTGSNTTDEAKVDNYVRNNDKGI